MGGQESKESSDDVIFQSTAEKQSLQSYFNEIASETNRKCKKKDMISRWSVTLENVLATRLIDYLYAKASDEGINFKSYVFLYGKFIKGALHEQVEIINSIISNNGNGNTTQTSDLLMYVKNIVSSYIKAHKETPKFRSWYSKLVDTTDNQLDRIAFAFLRDVVYENSVSGKDTFSAIALPSRSISNGEVETWLNKSSEIIFMQTDLFMHIYLPEEDLYCKKGSLIPSCLGVPGHLQLKSVLDATSLILLNSSLPPEFRIEWHFLFSSSVHGESFSKVLGCIAKKGPTVIIVVDTGGNTFGGFAPVCWDLGPKFYGDDRSFLFSLAPKMGIYRPTGYNNHYMYLNIQQQTLPNGLGMGGQFGYFGLWIDAEFGKGSCSKSCTTFDCPPLSSDAEFEIQHVEVWSVGKPPPTPQELGERPSVLDGNYEAKALLNMAGKEEHSLGYREPEDLDL